MDENHALLAAARAECAARSRRTGIPERPGALPVNPVRFVTSGATGARERARTAAIRREIVAAIAAGHNTAPRLCAHLGLVRGSIKAHICELVKGGRITTTGRAGQRVAVLGVAG